jgi:hypothetical protein
MPALFSSLPLYYQILGSSATVSLAHTGSWENQDETEMTADGRRADALLFTWSFYPVYCDRIRSGAHGKVPASDLAWIRKSL